MPFATAVILALVCAATGDVFTVKFPEFSPAGIVMLAWLGWAALLLLVSETTVSEVAAQSNVTVPVVLFPPVTLAEASIRVPTPIGLTVREMVLLEGPRVAVTVPVCLLATALVLQLKPACEAPAGTITLIGKVAAELALAIVTETPPAGAGPVSDTVPLRAWGHPPTTFEGNTRAETERGITLTISDLPAPFA